MHKFRGIYDEISRRCYVKSFEFNTDNFLINFTNKVFHVSTGTTMPHSKDFLHNYALQANIGTTTGAQFKSSVTRAFLLSICEGDKERLRLLQEMCGVLISDLPLKGAIFWVGAHDSGKSTLAKLLKSLFLPEHFSAVPLEKFDDKFRLSQLVNTRLNVGGEISRQTNALQWKLFKELTGGDTVSVEAKYVNALNVEIRTKLLFLGNFMPNMPNAALCLQ